MMSITLVVLLAVFGLGVNAGHTCGSQTCGTGAHCIDKNRTPECACLQGRSGDPLIQCYKVVCVNNSDCRSEEKCVNQNCVDACEGICGVNANCEAKNHEPECSCPDGYTGDPFSSCQKE